MENDDHVWELKEVASFLKLPKSTIYKLASSKQIPGFKVGKHWRFFRSKVIAWCHEQEGEDHAEV